MGTIKQEILDFLGDGAKFIQQEFMGGVIILKTPETEQYFGADEDFDRVPGDSPLTHYWFGFGEDFDKIHNTEHFKDGIIYTTIDRYMPLVEKVLTSKDLEYLENNLGWKLDAVGLIRAGKLNEGGFSLDEIVEALTLL